MREYLEQQLKKKAHEVVMFTYRVANRAKGARAAVMALRKSASKIPVSIFEGQARDFDEDKIRYFAEARSALFEVRYYLDILYREKAISYYSYTQVNSRLELLDKLLVSRISAVDKRKAKSQYRTVIKARYNY
jgi:four helix bundle protein